MSVRVGINGLGRIGKVVFRILRECRDIELTGINDLMDPGTLVHLIRYDSTHGRFAGNITTCKGGILTDGHYIHVSSEKDPSKISWKEWNVDIVLESSGYFTSRKLLQQHLDAGAQRVILSCPPQGPVDRTVILGVNDGELKRDDGIISNASCTTNCLAPVLRVLDENFGIDRVFMNTVHPYTNNQTIIDAPHRDLRRARTAGSNLIPTTSTAIQALLSVMPEMTGRFDGLAVRVPVHDGSLIELSAILKSTVTAEGINRTMQDAATGPMHGILSYTEEPIVSSDIIGDPHSGIVDGSLTRVLGGNFVQMIVWYDNETGYSNRIVDLIRKVALLMKN